MKPEDLKPPFPKEDRRIFINDRVWYVPDRIQKEKEFVFPGWENSEVFGNEHPVCIEYCSGNGAWIAAKAAANPQFNWVGIERKFDRVRKIWSKMKNMKLNNLLIVCGEAHNATKRYIPDNSVSDVYINFPDPWPKNRHAKNRLIQNEFVEQLYRILKPGQSMTFVTDDQPYSEWLIEVMQKQKGFTSDYPPPYFEIIQPDYGTSYFDELWRSKGRTIRYHKFRKN